MKKIVVFYLIILAYVGGAYTFYLFIYKPQQENTKKAEWQQFKVKHNCKLVSVGNGEGDQYGWFCDNGGNYYNHYSE